MSDIAIKVEELSKLYKIGPSKKDSIHETFKNLFSNKKTLEKETDFWALKDVSFEIKEGEAVGIIGKNGAGKSTLLKILSKITEPTDGKITINGRVSSLLEVGTGFHPELTGRENIFLNGTILGMKRAEIRGKFDEIVAFSGIEKFIDTPVKRYSSGMYVRLAFAVAAHLEPEILIIDEVLAVGDAEFQKKCLGKMEDVSKNGGRTVLFVSHNMGAVQSFCTKGILMKNGSISFAGQTNATIEKYLNHSSEIKTEHYINSNPTKDSYFKEVYTTNSTGISRNEYGFDESVLVNFKVQVDAIHLSAYVGFRIKDQFERIIFTSEIKLKDYNATTAGEHAFTAAIPAKLLVPNSYYIIPGFHIPNMELIEVLDNPISFKILETGSDFFQYNDDYGCIFANCQWKSINNVVL